MEQNDLQYRLFSFAVTCIKFLRILPANPEYKVIRYQLIKSSTSAGANYDESQAATSKADFHNKVKIALREVKESKYWLRILNDIIDFEYNKQEITRLIDESDQLSKILGSIANKTKK
jgi:four helix bundle protein